MLSCMEETPELLALLTLVLAGGATAPRRRLLNTYASAATALAAGPPVWRACGLSAAQQQLLRLPDAAALLHARTWLQHPGHHLLAFSSPDLPPQLLLAPSPPLALFVDGDPLALWQPSVAIVGSRRPTHCGRDNARLFAGELAHRGICVASGLAEGVDAIAHEAALDVPGGKTVAIVGTGPDRFYPSHHAALQRRIAERSAVVSEHPPGTGPRASHFPARNRLLASLSVATLVVEAAHRSGALITARHAGEAGRAVCALPGSIHNPMARGCHRLLREGALLVTCVDELLEDAGMVALAVGEAIQRRLDAGAPENTAAGGEPAGVDTRGATLEGASPATTTNAASRETQLILAALGDGPEDLDTLALRTGLSAAALSSRLVTMELQHLVAGQFGRYCRRR